LPFIGARSAGAPAVISADIACPFGDTGTLARREAANAISVRKSIREGRGVLFLTYKAGETAALRRIVSIGMRLAIFETINAEPAIIHPSLFGKRAPLPG
jgi:hypothetical protein